MGLAIMKPILSMENVTQLSTEGLACYIKIKILSLYNQIFIPEKLVMLLVNLHILFNSIQIMSQWPSRFGDSFLIMISPSLKLIIMNKWILKYPSVILTSIFHALAIKLFPSRDHNILAHTLANI